MGTPWRPIYEDGTSVTDDKWDAKFVDVNGVRAVEVTKSFCFELHGEVTYHERAACKSVLTFPWAMTLDVAGRTKEVTLAVRWPGARKFHVQAYGQLSARSTTDITSTGATFHYAD